MRWALPLSIVVIAAGASAACNTSGGPDDVSRARCSAFAKQGEPALRIESVVATKRTSPIVRIVASDAGKMYALDRDGRFGVVGGDATILLPDVVDVAVGPGPGGAVAAYAARWRRGATSTMSFELVRLTSDSTGTSFDPASEKVVLQVAGVRDVPEATSMTLGPRGFFLALGDGFPLDVSPTMLGKILKLAINGDLVTADVWAAGVHEPRGLAVDDATGDMWLTDRTKDDTAIVHRIPRQTTEPLVPALYLTSSDRRAAQNGGHVPRGNGAPSLVGKYVYVAQNGELVAIARFGPSGPAEATVLDLTVDGPVGRGPTGETAAATSTGVGSVVDASPRSAPTSLLATNCWNKFAAYGAPPEGIPYDVVTPLWSDGAVKERFVVVPPDAQITTRPDGDFVFPVGTVAVKTFIVDGLRIETRLLVQHDLDDWVGYSYAWNAAGTDANLVVGDRSIGAAGQKGWYFPSTSDCTSCHTPAAGYTLGLEAKQILGKGREQLEERLAAPLDRERLTPLVAIDAPATAEARARSYLHANCSMCHREGSVTGTAANLDLRVDTLLAATGLCGEPRVTALGITNARIIAPRDPASSVLVKRMRALDEHRMPKLASRVVDEAGTAAVEAWIRDLASCP